MRRPPSRIEPISNVPDILDFPRDIQPILDKHCIRCHKGTDAPKRVNLTSDSWSRYGNFSFGYLQLFRRAAHAHNGSGNRPPRSLGSGARTFLTMLRKGHKKVKLSDREMKLLRLWVDCGAHYAGTYAALGSGGHGVDMEKMQPILERRCAPCHGYFDRKGRLRLRFRAPAERIWNVDAPDKALLLRAPLARDAGGLGKCRGAYRLGRGARRKHGRRKLPSAPKRQPPFADKRDADYRAMRDLLVQAGPWRKQFFMEGFRPNDHWIREMKRYGVLDADYDISQPIDVYEVERRYWRSLWYRPSRDR
jgi:hypothetical protein